MKFKHVVAAQYHVIALGAGEGMPPPGWSLESELTDPTADTAPLATHVPVGADKASEGPVAASVEALQRLARALESNVTALEQQYGYGQFQAQAERTEEKEEGKAEGERA